MTLRQSDALDRPPVPVPGCASCAELAVRRDEARARYDRSAEADANVLLRHHHLPVDVGELVARGGEAADVAALDAGEGAASWMRGMELLAKEVMPQLADLSEPDLQQARGAA